MPSAIFALSVLTLLNLTLLFHYMQASELYFIPAAGYNTECKVNETLDTMCQKCAKKTYPNIYVMCCRNEESVAEWCKSYLEFGIRPRGRRSVFMVEKR